MPIISHTPPEILKEDKNDDDLLIDTEKEKPRNDQ
jgi:hypothetical protein